jgi:nucleoside-diphosphate-sugar epimerase
LGFGYAPNIVEACVNSGISRAIFVSSTSIFSKLNAPTKSQRIQSELMIAESGLSFTIIRPTMIYGSPRDRNIWKLIEFINRWSVVPVIGGGRALQQPVYVNDVAQCIVNAIHCDHSIGKSYNIAGSEPLSYLDIIDVISTGIGSNVKKIYCPVIVARIAAQLFGGIGLRITEEQVLRFEENKVIDNSSAIEQLGYSPLDFEQGLGFELQWLDK